MIRSQLELEVRYYETDQMGIVHHSNYIRYFECGRSKLLVDLGLPIEQIEAAGIVFPVVSVNARYRQPAKMGDRLRIVSTVEKVPEGAKLPVKAEIYNQDGVLLCEGTVTLGFLDARRRIPVRCPEFIAEVFRRHEIGDE